MSISAKSVRFDENNLWVDLSDGRTLGVPLAWFPRLMHATPQQRLGFEISRDGLHWAEIDQDISIAGLLAGRGDQGRRFEKSELSDVFAILKTDGPSRSMDDMDAAVLAEARRQNVGD